MLRETSQEKALRLAAVRSLEECARIQARIRKAHLRTGHDPDGRPPRLERLVAHIGEHLFEASLSVEGACKAVDIGDRAVGGELRAYAGCTVDELIDKLRIDTAYDLVVGTDIRLGDISHLVGFRAYRTFTRTYSIFVGEPPQQTRKRHARTPFDLPVDEPYNFRDFKTVRRLGEREATPNELERLRRTLGELYPDTFGDHKEEAPEATAAVVLPPVLDTEVFERFVAEHQVWLAVRDLPFAEQRRFVRRYPCWTPALFEFLHHKSREEGRRDRQRGIELSQLALDSLDGNEDRLGERIHSLRAQGWAWLGNARRLALEFPAADSALRKAEGMLRAHECQKDPFAGGVVYICKGTLRMAQRRQPEAIDLFDLAFTFFLEAESNWWQVQTLLHRSSASFYLGKYEDMEPNLEQAKTLLPASSKELEFQIVYTMANTFRTTGDPERAELYMPRLSRLAADLPVPLWRHQVQWLAANIDHDAGRAQQAELNYIAAWQAVGRLGEPLYEARILLDLSILYVEIGKLSKVTEIVAAIYPVFASIRLYDEAAASLKLLNRAVSESNVSRLVLAKLRSSLCSDPLVSIAVSTEGVRPLDLTPCVNTWA